MGCTAESLCFDSGSGKGGNFIQVLQTGFGDHQASYLMRNGQSSPRDTAVGAWSQSLHLVPRLSIRGDVTLFPHTALCCAHWQLDSYLDLSAKLWSKMRKCFFSFANTWFRRGNLDVTPQNSRNTVFYIISGHNCKTNLLELLRYFSYFHVYKRGTQHKSYVSSILFTCNCITNEVK